VIIIALAISASCNHAPGIMIVMTAKFPMSYGFDSIFQMHNPYLYFLNLPPLVVSIHCFLFSISRQLSAMAASNLLPSFLRIHTTQQQQFPHVAWICGVMSVILVSGIISKFLNNRFHGVGLINCLSLTSYVMNIFLLISYLKFQKKYRLLPKTFSLTIYGRFLAWFGIIIFSLCAISLIVFGVRGRFALMVVGSIWFLLTIYYNMFVGKHQQFSEEEQSILFPGYVINGKLLNIL
jgi:L-asparagine transporter-like permease